MYLWKINELVLSIKNEKLSEQDRFHYLMIYLAVSLAAVLLLNYSSTDSNERLDTLHNIVYSIIVIIGTYSCYLVNGASLGSDFLGKYFSVGCVVSIRATIFFIPILIAFKVVFYNHDSIYLLFVTLLSIGLEAFIFWKMYVYIQKANS